MYHKCNLEKKKILFDKLAEQLKRVWIWVCVCMCAAAAAYAERNIYRMFQVEFETGKP